MVFGEIVEPTTRALIVEDEDLEELPNYQGPIYKWEGDPEPPEYVETLIFIEHSKVLNICFSLINKKQPVARIVNEGIEIYNLNAHFLVLFNGKSNSLLLGEIVEILSPWITKAKTIHAITTSLFSTLQPSESFKDLVTVTKCLTNSDDVPFNFCSRLQSPNLIQGLGATVLSYCIHNRLKANLWVIYTDNMPLDSVNSAEIVRLLKTLGFEVNISFTVNSTTNNLYM